MTPEQIAAVLQTAMDRPNPMLFAGSGVGRRVNLPDWRSFIEHLAAVCDQHGDITSGRLIRERVERGQFLSAASVFKTCESIPIGERWKALAAPFTQELSPELVDRLCPLVTLGFTAIVTTNYDTSMHQARARAGKGWTLPIELDDDSLGGASLATSFFLARLHGRAQKPTSMVVDQADYARILNNEAYLDFVLDVLKSRSCIFVGFSFVDPAIDHLLRLYKDKVGPVFDRLHTAIVPDGARELIDRLTALNIETATYDPADDHNELWRAIRIAYDGRNADQRKLSAVVTPQLTIPAIHQFMAFAYAQVRSSQTRQPITGLVQDGIVLSCLPTVGTGMDVEAINANVRKTLRMSPEEAAIVVDSSIPRLIAKDQVRKLGEKYLRQGHPNTVLEDHLNLLVFHVVDRVRVRSGVRVAVAEAVIIRNALETIFVWRAWDVAAHFAGSGTRLGTDIEAAVARAIAEAARNPRLPHLKALVDGVVSLLTSPEDREAPILAEIGRAAFGLQLVLSTPRQALFRRHALPETIYLDSNVLMPAITVGHPHQPVYSDALDRLLDASRKSGLTARVVVGNQFLNEVISHRKLAIQIAAELAIEDPRRLEQHVLFYSSANGNVFIGGYSGWIAAGVEGSRSFEAYLSQVAPYQDEGQLSAFLQKRGITTEDMTFRGKHGGRYAAILGRLLGGYEQDLQRNAKVKDTLLIEHEAEQLTKLFLDHEHGHRSIFVSSDGHLRRVIQRDEDLKPLAATVVSHVGLVALVDVMVGLDGDTGSLARLMWASPHVDQERAVFDYFVNVALRNYQEGMALEMQDAAQRVAKALSQEANADQLHLFGKRATDVVATAKLLDRYEDRFFEYWREAIERREPPAEQ